MRSIDKIVKSNNRIPGLSVRNAQSQVNTENRIRQKNKSSESGDIANRNYVQSKIIEYIKSGVSKEEIIEKILKDPIMKQFEYLTNNGLKIEACVEGWVENAIKRNDKKSEKTR